MMAEPGVATAPEAAVDEVVATARQALLGAPPLGAPEYLRFAETVSVGAGRRWAEFEEANAQDLEDGRAGGLSGPFLDRIRLDERHLELFRALGRSIARELPELVRQGPVVTGLGGLRARRVPRPLGVVFMIYEAKPTVTVEGALVAVCSGNAAILRGSTEIAATNAVLGDVLAKALTDSELPEGMVQVLGDTDRNQFRQLLRRDDAIDLLIPRGSPSLVDYCRGATQIPVLVGGGGVNHLYVHDSADLVLAVRVVEGVDEAIAHVRRHGSGHTEGIVSESAEAIERFCRQVDAAAVIVNGSLRLHDGPTMGLGAELAISTGRLHVRGPVTLSALVTHTWLIEGNGAVRFLD